MKKVNILLITLLFIMLCANVFGQSKNISLILLELYFANFKPAVMDQYENLKTAQLQYPTKGLHFVMYDDTAWYNTQVAAFFK